MSLPSNRAERETIASPSPDSHRVMGLIVRRAILPAPECRTLSRSSFLRAVEPVRSSSPRWLPESSTNRRAASQTSGTSCHSSTRCGMSPRSAKAGSSSAASRSEGLSSFVMLALRDIAVQVLPHHFGPLISTHPKASMRESSRFSSKRGLYPLGVSVFDLAIVPTSMIWAFDILHDSQSIFYRKSIRCFAGFSIDLLQQSEPCFCMESVGVLPVIFERVPAKALIAGRPKTPRPARMPRTACVFRRPR